MSAPPNRTLAWALALARADILVFPCKSHDRAPATKNGFKDATTNETQIRTWFGRNPSWNLAIRCGPQPCGLNLVVLDVDAQSGGLETWKAWEAAHTVPETVRHETPSSGFHLFLDAPEEFRPSANSFGVGIDVRGSDSYVVAPPSVAPSKITGELLPYRGHQELFLGDQGSVAAMPADIRAQLVAISSNGHRGTVVPLRWDHPSQFDLGDSVADLARVGWGWLVELPRDGWTFVRRDGGDTYWTRPGKDPRFGSSAVLHSQSSPDGGPLVTYSTSLPVGGKPARGAAIGSFSPWDYIVAFRAGGDTREAARLVRGVAPAPRRVALARTPDSDDTPGDNESLYLPDAFWTETELLAEVRDQALMRLRTPDAVLAALLTMYATTIPMNFWLPGFVGAQAPLNLYAVVVGRSGGGKTSAMTMAAQLMGSPGNSDILLRKQLRSGEGLITLVNRPGKRGSKDEPDVPPSTRVGVHVHYDEGGALSRQQNQSASTIIPYLNTAWSGAGTVGGAKADGDAGFDASRVRICALIGVQYGIGANLFTGEAATLGFPQRLLFLSADEHPMIQSQEMPDEVVATEPMGLPFLHHYDYVHPVFVTLPREVRQEVWDWSKTRPDPLEGHAMNLRLRVATVLMLLHGGGDRDFGFWWSLANTVMTVHRDVRHAFVSSIHQVAEERDTALGQSLGRRAEAQHEYNLDKGVASLLGKLGDKTIPTRALKDHFKSWRNRYGFDHRDVISRAELLGLIVADGAGWRKR